MRAPSPIQQTSIGREPALWPAVCEGCRDATGNCAQVLPSVSSQITIRVHPSHLPLPITDCISRTIRFFLTLFWAKQVTDLCWDSSPRLSTATQQNYEVICSRDSLCIHQSLCPGQIVRPHSRCFIARCGHMWSCGCILVS